MNVSLSFSVCLNFRSADIGSKSAGKSITVAAAGIGHLVYPDRIRRRTDIPNTVDSGQRSGAFTTPIHDDPLCTLDLRNHSR